MINKHPLLGKLGRILFIGIFYFIVIDYLISNPIYAEGENSSESAEMMPFYWMVFIVGGCIAITLSYVSWRKYKGEKKKIKKDKMID